MLSNIQILASDEHFSWLVSLVELVSSGWGLYVGGVRVHAVAFRTVQSIFYTVRTSLSVYLGLVMTTQRKRMMIRYFWLPFWTSFFSQVI